jgi:isopenicillin N synthase-like dioxygenase
MAVSKSFQGLWQRLILARPAEAVETLTRTSWLQGPALFADLRQPPAISGRVLASCLAEVEPDEARVMACQEGFAGRFVVSGDIAEWQRQIDFQAPGALRDRGRLVREGELLIEHGVEEKYVEYWQLEPQQPEAPCAAASFVSEADGREVILVQHGSHFAYARDRARPLARGSDLSALLCDTNAQEAQALVDCEISFGTVTAEGWRIDRSTLPWREGALLVEPDAAVIGGRFAVADVDARGLPVTRALRLMDLHGVFAFAPPPPALAAPVAVAAKGPFREIPVIDIAPLGGSDPAAEQAVVEQLRLAASEVGFFHVSGHGIAPAVTARLRAASQRFFGQSQKRKMASYIGRSANHRGYVPEGEEAFGEGMRDRKEAFDLALDLPAERVPAGNYPGGHPMLGPNQWPDLPGFREDVMAYYAAAFAAGRRLLRGLCMALGQPAEALDHLVLAPPSQLRLIHYPAQADAEDSPGIGAHTDYECFTLLLASSPGLEVMNQAGEWIDAPPVPGALVVNIGDMMEFWSGGEFVATSHRVRRVAEERWSFPLFFALDYDTELMPLGRSGAARAPIRTGEHLYAQTVRTFRYLQQRAIEGQGEGEGEGVVALPQMGPQAPAFGQQARHRIQS